MSQLNLNQNFHSFSDVQATFPNMAGFVLASEGLTMTGLIVNYKGAEWLVIFAKEAKEIVSDIPDQVLRSMRSTIRTLEGKIERLNHGLDLDRKFSGGGRYEAESFTELDFSRIARDIRIMASDLSKHGYNPAIVLNRLKCQSIPKISEAAKDWL
jgi:hypothetical protein